MMVPFIIMKQAQTSLVDRVLTALNVIHAAKDLADVTQQGDMCDARFAPLHTSNDRCRTRWTPESCSPAPTTMVANMTLGH